MEQELKVYNPADGTLAGTLSMLDEEAFQAAIEKAMNAKKEWRETSIYDRTVLMEYFMELVLENAEELAEILTAEMGKPIVQAREEIAAAIDITRSFVQRANHLYGASCIIKSVDVEN